MRFLVSFVVLAAACADLAPTGPVQPSFQADVVSAEGGSSVLRRESSILIAIQDPGADLRAVIGLPDDPRQSPLCGGAEPLELAQYQESGIDKGAVQALAKAEDVNIHLYRRSTFRGLCATTPYAVGSGRLVYTDNDLFGSSTPRHNSFGFSFHGDVTLADGSSGRVHARNQIVVDKNGTFDVVVNFINLAL